MQQSATHHRSCNTARIGFNYTGIRKSALKLSFALLVSSIWAFFAKRTISNLRSTSRRVAWNYLSLDDAPSILLGLQQNLTQFGEVGISFLLYYFSALSEHFLPKEISQIFAPIPGGPHVTYRGALFMSGVVLFWRSTTQRSLAT
jgi:hypothetical protein